MTWRRKGGKRGTAMAEAAITLPVIMLLTFAMVNGMPGTAGLVRGGGGEQCSELWSAGRVGITDQPDGKSGRDRGARAIGYHLNRHVRDQSERGRISRRTGKCGGGLGSAKLYRKSDNLHRRRRSDELCRHCPFYIPAGGLVNGRLTGMEGMNE